MQPTEEQINFEIILALILSNCYEIGIKYNANIEHGVLS